MILDSEFAWSFWTWFWIT